MATSGEDLASFNKQPLFSGKQYDAVPVSNRGDIRILKLYGSSSNQDDVVCELIRGTIIDVPQDHRPQNGHPSGPDGEAGSPPAQFKPYDALSWCWGKNPEESPIYIRVGETRYEKSVQANLVAALRALRHKTHDRHLWVDAVCINQAHEPEKNHQVEMMGEIYGKADCVRIWLGDADASSDLAIRFIKQKVLQLDHFDNLCRSNEFSNEWKSLLELMQREWFSRRWVVQEVALAPKAIIHCGLAKLSWTKFSVAVELFVEVETATHRLSEVMKTDTKWNHVPRWFEYISQLGASLLVDATGKLFRDYDYLRRIEANSGIVKRKTVVGHSKVPNELDYESEDDEVIAPAKRAELHKEQQEKRRRMREEGTINISPKAQPLLTLEYLVSNLSIFDVTTPHDSVYALLGIAKDTTPTAANKELHVSDHTRAVLERFTAKKQYKVDYQADYIDVCKDFIEFCVRRNTIRDPSRALDVICRPFALDLDHVSGKLPLPSWVPRLSKASYGMDRGPGIDGLRMGRKNADSLVGLPNLTQRNYNAAETKSLDKKVFRFRKRIFPRVNAKPAGGSSDGDASSSKPDASQQSTVHQHQVAESSAPSNQNAIIEQVKRDDLTEPRPREQTGNVAVPITTQSTTVQSTKQQSVIVSTNVHDHYSLYASGFVLDMIAEVQPSSQSGSIPTAWAHLAKWSKMEDTPPEHFWRTLVADRGSLGSNPPVYYSRACQESFRKGNTTSGVVDTTGLIEHERNSVVAQFCRRVQAAIWNRAMVRTEAGRLGLVEGDVREGDLVCIIYGCSVPVVLRKHGPKRSQIKVMEMDYELKFLANYVGESYKTHLERRKQFREKREEDKEIYKLWEKEKQKEWEADKLWHTQWKKVREGLTLIHEFRSWVLRRQMSGQGHNGFQDDATKNDKELMKNILSKVLDDPGIYAIAKMAARCDNTDQNIVDYFRGLGGDAGSREDPQFFSLAQQNLWDNFRSDAAWRAGLQEICAEYRESEGFRAWACQHKKFYRYAGVKQKWKNDEAAQRWTDDWQAENSWFLCIDSFRAWLRERGKIVGGANDAKVADDHSISRQGRASNLKEWADVLNSDSSADEKKIALLALLQDHEDEQERLRKEDDAKREAEREKRDKEKFHERWRPKWGPGVVDWSEFGIAFKYGRRWLKAYKKARIEQAIEHQLKWGSNEETKARQCRRMEQFFARRPSATKLRDLNYLKCSENRQEEKEIAANDHRLMPMCKPMPEAAPGSVPREFNSMTTPTLASTVLQVAVGDTEDYSENPDASTDPQDVDATSLRGTKRYHDGEPVIEVGLERRFTFQAELDSTARKDTFNNNLREMTFSSRLELSQAVELKKRGLTQVWTTSMARIEEQTRNWTDRRQMLGNDGEYHADFRPPSKAERLWWKNWSEKELKIAAVEASETATNEKGVEPLERSDHRAEQPSIPNSDGDGVVTDAAEQQPVVRKRHYELLGRRQRLRTSEQLKYKEKIEENFKKKLGDDGNYYYEMMGECYVHGMMDGEAMASQNNEGIRTSVFEIR